MLSSEKGIRMRISKISLLILVISLQCVTSYAGKIAPEMMIAHAGGDVKGKKLTNSYQALYKNIEKGYVYFEVDLEWTLDNKLVLIHDWDYTLYRLYCLNDQIATYGKAKSSNPASNNIKQNLPLLLNCKSIPDFTPENVADLRRYILQNYNYRPTYNEFMGLKMKENLKQLDVDGLMEWLSRNKNKRIVTDVKINNLKALTYISKKYPSMLQQVMPQIYSFDEYENVKSMGYKNIILTLYKMYDPSIHDKIIKFALENPLFAITMPKEIAASTNLVHRLKANNVSVYVHTVNSMDEFYLFQKLGVSGVYTDFLLP